MELKELPTLDNLRDALSFWQYLLLSSVLLLGIIAVGVGAVLFPTMILLIILGVVGGSFLSIGITARPYWIIFFLVVFMPFEDFIIKYIPGPNIVRFGAQFASELLIYLTFLIVLVQRVRDSRSWRRSPLDIPLLIFVFFAILSTLLNRPPLFGSFVNIRSLLRYVVLFYLVINLDLSSKQIRSLVGAVIVIGALQIAIGAVQLLTKGEINQFLLPKTTEIDLAGFSRRSIAAEKGRELGSIFGTLGDTIFFSLFMLVVFAVYLGRVRQYRIKHFLFLGIVFLAANFAYTRAVVFSMLLVAVISYRLRYGINRLLLLFIVLLPLLFGGVVALANSSFIYQRYKNPGRRELSIVENITGIFTIDYLERAQWQRLGAVLGIPPTVLANKPFFGYGPDELTTIEGLNDSFPSFLYRTLVKEGFEDVYWTALLAYFGIFGTLAFIWLIYRLYSSARETWRASRDKLTREIAFSVACLAGASPFLLFFYRVYEFRIFSFYLWLFAGLMINSNFRARRRSVSSHEVSADGLLPPGQ